MLLSSTMLRLPKLKLFLSATFRCDKGGQSSASACRPRFRVLIRQDGGDRIREEVKRYSLKL